MFDVDERKFEKVISFQGPWLTVLILFWIRQLVFGLFFIHATKPFGCSFFWTWARGYILPTQSKLPRNQYQIKDKEIKEKGLARSLETDLME